MPSKSPAQARLMRAVAHGWHKPGGDGPTPAVAKEFVKADESKKKGKRTREQRADRKRSVDEWASSGRSKLAEMDT